MNKKEKVLTCLLAASIAGNIYQLNLAKTTSEDNQATLSEMQNEIQTLKFDLNKMNENIEENIVFEDDCMLWISNQYLEKMSEDLDVPIVDLPTQYLNVGEKTVVEDGGVMWIPLEYLETAFGITYRVEGKAVILEEGLLLPVSVLLDAKASKGESESKENAGENVSSEVEEVEEQVEVKEENPIEENQIEGEVNPQNGAQQNQTSAQLNNGGSGSATANVDGTPKEPANEEAPKETTEVKEEKPVQQTQTSTQSQTSNGVVPPHLRPAPAIPGGGKPVKGDTGHGEAPNGSAYDPGKLH